MLARAFIRGFGVLVSVYFDSLIYEIGTGGCYPAQAAFATLVALHETHGCAAMYCVIRNIVVRQTQAGFRTIVVANIRAPRSFRSLSGVSVVSQTAGTPI